MINKISIEDIVKETIDKMGLPETTQSVGFAVHLPESDEFLADSQETKLTENRMWSKIPDIAKIFSQKKAIKEAKKYGNGACVTLLLDTGPQYVNVLSLGPEELKQYDKKGKLKTKRKPH